MRFDETEISVWIFLVVATPCTDVSRHHFLPAGVKSIESDGVLVHREMECERSPLASIAPIPPGPVCTEKRWRAGGKAATETATGFQKKIRLAWPVHINQRAQTETG
jgi:hypothetical protein